MCTEVCKINLSRKTYIKNWYYEFMILYRYSYYVHGYFVQLTENMKTNYYSIILLLVYIIIMNKFYNENEIIN